MDGQTDPAVRREGGVGVLEEAVGEVYEGHPALRTGRGVRKEETENPRADHGSLGVAGGRGRHREVVLRTLKSSPSVTWSRSD